MNAQTLLADAQKRGVVFTIKGDRLRYHAPPNALTVADAKRLREHKTELLALLSSGPTEPNAPAEYTVVRSALLDGAEIIFAPDDAGLPLDQEGRVEGLVVYREAELARLVANQPSPEALRTIHAIKELFGGEYTGIVKEGEQAI